MGFKIKVPYDATVLTPVSITGGEELSGLFEDNIGIHEDYFEVLWTGTENVMGNVNLFTITFKPSVGVSEICEEILLEYSQEDTFNEAWQDVVWDIEKVLLEYDKTNSSGTTEEEKPGETTEEEMPGATTEDKKPEGTVEEEKPGGTTQGDKSDSTMEEDSHDIKIKTLKIAGISKKIAAGKKIKLQATFYPENITNKSIEWKSSNKKYAVVNSKGVVSTKKAGAGKSVTITAQAQDGSGVVAKYKIKIVKHAVKSIKLPYKKKVVKAGKSFKVKSVVKVTGKTANKTLQWSSSNKKYATVTSKGVVKTKKAGKGKWVTITAQATDGTGKKAKIRIIMK